MMVKLKGHDASFKEMLQLFDDFMDIHYFCSGWCKEK